jgi:AcrR family transcriptional regulator
MTRAGLSRSSLARSAADLADEVGLAEVTLSRLARHVGVQAPSLYSHVANGVDLRRLVATLAMTELADALDIALAGRAGESALTAYAEAHRTYAHEHPGRFASTADLDLPVDEPMLTAGARLSRQTLAVLRDYRLSEDDQVHAARLVGATVRGFIDLERGGAFDHSTPPPSESWVRILHSLHETLRTWR